MARRLDGKVALVTGAARGIGAGIMAAFRQEGAVTYGADLNGTAAGDERYLCLDVRREADWQAAERLIREREGRLDILVNNAGVELVRPLPEISLADWRHVMAVNVEGVFLGCRIMQPLLAASGSAASTAAIINISSIAGIVGYPDQAAYNTSKGAVRHLTKSLAIEFAAHGQPIRVNSIHPGCIRTPMLEEAVEGWTRQGLLNRDDPWKDVGAMCPMNKVGGPADIAMGAVYLASDEAGFVTGIELVIDGGWVAR
ncbi:SDR family NAD(P)-dependent oxidoreductase [Niveispirillum fermenti]|uniref:SDR family NAD(P)-dependent oxidoreductase n=1 Tax=Niveispirillum fermenti TaxID=1233113 RepID=UPI003A88FE7C